VSSDDPEESIRDLSAEMLAGIERLAAESSAAFQTVVTSILEKERELLDTSIETLLTEHAVTVVRPHGVVRAIVTDPGTDDAVVRGEYEASTGSRGNSSVRLTLIPESELRRRLQLHLAAWIGNLVVTTDHSAGRS